MASLDAFGTMLVGAEVVAFASALIVGPTLWLRRKRRPALEQAAAWRELLVALGARFGLDLGDETLAGSAGGLAVTVTTEGGLPAVRVRFARPIMSERVRLCEWLDEGSPQRHEELMFDGASPSGDAAFDAQYLAYGTPEDVRALPPRLRALLLAQRIDGLQLSARELFRPLWHRHIGVGVPSPEVAERLLEETLTLCGALEALAGHGG